ncbi:MAG: hypothetical protein H8M99_09805 [Gloeobacteraceae cyanobacterium ES-bin-144]|nr:hypothetical protein [Verrucomicrobiales bacterium]
MAFAQSIRPFISLVIGLAVGGTGAIMFQQSLPAVAGSPEARANKMELELKKANIRIAALESNDTHGHRKTGRTFTDSARDIADDIREGKSVNPDDIFRASQPLLRDLAPLFDRMRLRQQRQVVESMSGELARKYNLTPQQQESLKQWFEQKLNDNAKQWNELVTSEGTRLEDLMRATRDIRPDNGLDQFMGSILSGDKLTDFKTQRMAEQAERVQQDADARVERLDSIVKLDDAQRDQVFGIMARGSKDYDPSMKIEGAGGEIGAINQSSRQQATLAVLRQDQRAAYEAEQKKRREEAEKDMQAIGLNLPAGWDVLDEESFN